MKKYAKVFQLDKDFKPIPEVDLLDKLPAGVYEVNADQKGDIFFSQISTNHDGLVDLPNTEYDVVVREIDNFMKPSTRAKFEKYQYVYKRSTLLYGAPGTGKTCIVNRIVQKVVAEGGVALFSPNPRLLEESFKILDSLQPETRIMVIFEEMDQLIKRYESELLNLLDGEIQKSNVIYVGTTNYIDKIPSRIRRPGRFSSVVSVGFPSEETRRFYLNYKLKDESVDVEGWVAKTQGFSIDELKETVAAVLCLDYELDPIVARIRANRETSEPKKENNYKFHSVDEDDDETEEFMEECLDAEEAAADAYKISLTKKDC